MQKYSIFSLARNALSRHENWREAWRSPEPKPEYDVVIVGGRFHPVGRPEIAEVLFAREFEPGDPRATGQISIDKLMFLREPGLQNHGAVCYFTCHFALAVMYKLLSEHVWNDHQAKQRDSDLRKRRLELYHDGFSQ